MTKTKQVQEIEVRNAAIFEARERGETWRSIGARLGISATTAAEAARNHRHILERAARIPGLNGLSVRSANGLAYNGATTPELVAELGAARLRRLPNIGAVSASEIEEWLAGHSIDMKE